MTRKAVLTAFLGLALAGSLSAQIPGGTRRSPEMLQAFRSVVSAAVQSTARVFGNGDPIALATVVGSDGLLITKYSELRGKLTCLLPSGEKVDAEVVGVEPKHDVALLKVTARGLTPVTWLASTKAQPGDWLATPGLGAEPLAVGVVGVATRSPKSRDYPSAPPSADSGYLGVYLGDGDGPATITDLEKGGPASKAGLKTGDSILKVDGRRIDTSDKLIETVQKYKAGEKLTLLIRRAGGGTSEEELEIELGKRKGLLGGGFDRGDFQNKMGSKLSVKRQGFPVVLQHDMVVEPKDCGGPVVNLDGKVIGVNIARAGRTESYAIPIEAVMQLLPDLRSGKLAVKADAADPEEVSFQRVRTMTKDLEALRVKEAEIEKNIERMKLIEEDGDKIAKATKELDEVRKKSAKLQADLEKERKK